MIIGVEDFHEDHPIMFNAPISYIPCPSLLNSFTCPNKNCFYDSNDKQKHQRHVNYCRSETSVKCKHTIYNQPEDNIKQELVNEGFMPDIAYENFYAVAFDIECLMVAPDEMANTNSIHRLVSIGIKTNLPPPNSFFFLRDDMDPESLKRLVCKFVTQLYAIQRTMTENLPQQILLGIKHYIDYMKGADYKKMSPSEKYQVRQKCEYLRELTKLRCYAWNSEHYDLCVLLVPLLDIFSNDTKKFSKINCIKRGSG